MYYCSPGEFQCKVQFESAIISSSSSFQKKKQLKNVVKEILCNFYLITNRNQLQNMNGNFECDEKLLRKKKTSTNV